MINVVKTDRLKIFLDELRKSNVVLIISPFISLSIVNILLDRLSDQKIKVITRFNLNDFKNGVSSISALQKLVEAGIEVIGIKGLHSKIYIFDKKSVIITSANFTRGGFFNNHEFGIKTTNEKIVKESIEYFDYLWSMNQVTLSIGKIKDWEKEISNAPISNGVSNLPDHGIDPIEADRSKRYFIKFFGNSENRVGLQFRSKDEIESAHCHYAVCFPNGKGRPRRYKNGDVVYMARMLHESNMAIFGKGIAIEHSDIRDIASSEEIKLRKWKNRWGIYIRVENTQFIDGIMADCPLTSQLVLDLGFESYQSTYLHHNWGVGNTDPLKAVRQQADVQLSSIGANWVESKFQEALITSGTVSDKFINSLHQGSLKQL